MDGRAEARTAAPMVPFLQIAQSLLRLYERSYSLICAGKIRSHFPEKERSLSAREEPSRLSPEMRTSIFYFTIYGPPAVITTLAGIWFAQQGFSSDDIGLIFAVPVFGALALNLILGRLADRAPDWKQAIVWSFSIAALAPIGLLFTTDFVWVMIFWAIANIIQSAATPVVDAAAMRLSKRRGSDYSTFRAWGTAGFLAFILVSGLFLHLFGAGIFVPIFVAVSVLRMAVSFTLPRFRAERSEDALQSGARSLGAVMRPWFVLPLVAWALVFSTHLVLNAFQALLFERQGVDEGVIGLLLATGVAVEAAVFFALRPYAERYPARYLILFSAVVAVFRWTMMGLAPGVAGLFALQLLHGFTFAVGFLGMVKFVADWTHEDIAARAQSFSAVLQGVAATTTIYCFGLLVDRVGPQTYFASAVLSLLAVACVVGSLLLRGARSERDEKLGAQA